MGEQIFQIDAFTPKPFGGNPAAVCFLEAERDDDWLQALAREMNLSETAFLTARGADWDLRWFTPAFEVDLCGHATLASAHALWETERLRDEDAARFHTRSGLLTCTRTGDWIEMDFPATPPEEAAPSKGLLEALGIASPSFCGRNSYDAFVELESEKTLRALEPDFRGLAEIDVRGVIVTARAEGSEFDFVSRFFAPRAGIDEDPVTGSAHCTLTPYWAAKLGRPDMLAFQASARGGVVRVGHRGERVLLGGRAVTVLKGRLA